MKNLFKGKQYDYKIIIEAISLYYHLSLSYRDYAQLMRKFIIPVEPYDDLLDLSQFFWTRNRVILHLI